mmetsp:Transcript_36736/g.60159  ORF Transcript_36736/g.60159 Transcript_36736/m.60159 type:complete len:274 (-) Transcript_36736:49-870(-)
MQSMISSSPKRGLLLKKKASPGRPSTKIIAVKTTVRDDEAAPHIGIRFAAPPRLNNNKQQQQDHLLWIERTWGIMKQQKSTLNGSFGSKTHYVSLFDNFFNELKNKRPTVVDFFGSGLKARMKSFDEFMSLVRNAFKHSNEEKKSKSMFKNHKLSTDDLLCIEAAFVAALRSVLFDFVRSQEKRAQAVEAWTAAVRHVLRGLLKAHQRLLCFSKSCSSSRASSRGERVSSSEKQQQEKKNKKRRKHWRVWKQRVAAVFLKSSHHASSVSAGSF